MPLFVVTAIGQYLGEAIFPELAPELPWLSFDEVLDSLSPCPLDSIKLATIARHTEREWDDQ